MELFEEDEWPGRDVVMQVALVRQKERGGIQPLSEPCLVRVGSAKVVEALGDRVAGGIQGSTLAGDADGVWAGERIRDGYLMH